MPSILPTLENPMRSAGNSLKISEVFFNHEAVAQIYKSVF